MIGKKTTRYCGKCKQTFTKCLLEEFERHAKDCNGDVKRGLLVRAGMLRAAKEKVQLAERPRRVAEAMPVAIAVAPAAVAPPPQHPIITEHIKKFEVGPREYCGLVVDAAHLKEAVLEQYENPDLLKELEDVSAFELLDMQKKAKWDDGVLDRWYGWGDSQAFKNGDAMVAPLKTVVEYSEKDTTASKDIKPKLRYVTKALRNEAMDGRDVIAMISCHGFAFFVLFFWLFLF